MEYWSQLPSLLWFSLASLALYNTAVVKKKKASDASNAYEWFVDEDAEEVELNSEADDDTDEEIEVQFESDEECANIFEGDQD
ncbi:hypothetical protein Q3G72_010757 [Acer saccharum]|nr:hypothetical protein Q3G72_010757 [Acer saccharum]